MGANITPRVSLTIGIVIFIIMCVALYGMVSVTMINEQKTKFSLEQPPKYRVMVIIDGSSEVFRQQFHQGITESAKEHKVALEFWSFQGEDRLEQQLKQFNIALLSNVDGIIVQGQSGSAFDNCLKEADKKGISVVTVGADTQAEVKLNHVSYNRYQLGQAISDLINKDLTHKNIGEGDIIVLSDEDDPIDNLTLAINQTIGNRYSIISRKLKSSGVNLLNAQDATIALLKEYPNMVGIITLTSEYSLGVIHGLREVGKLNDVSVISFGTNDKIMDFVSRGITLGSIAIPVKQMGEIALDNIVNHKQNIFVPSYSDVEVQIISNNGNE